MFTVEDLRTHRCNHREYYGQYVNDDVRGSVLTVMGENRLIQAFHLDGSFNSIPLFKWDALGVVFNFYNAMKTRGDTPSLEGKVYILKEAAQQIVDKLLKDGKYVDQEVG